MVACFSEFVTYLLLVVIMAGVAVCGVFVGKKLRDNKNAKEAVAGTDSKAEEG